MSFIISDACLMLWGGDSIPVPTPQNLQSPTRLFGFVFPTYRLVLVGCAIGTAIALYFLIERTRLGAMIRAGVDDRQMARAVGIPVSNLFTGIFCLGAGIAGAGAIEGGGRSRDGAFFPPPAILRGRFLHQSRQPDPDRSDLRAQPEPAGGFWRDDFTRTRVLSRRRRLYFRAADKPIRIRTWDGRDHLDRGHHRDGGVLRRHRASRHGPGLSHDHAGLVASALGARLPHV